LPFALGMCDAIFKGQNIQSPILVTNGVLDIGCACEDYPTEVGAQVLSNSPGPLLERTFAGKRSPVFAVRIEAAPAAVTTRRLALLQ